MTHSLHPKYFYTQPANIGSGLLGKASGIGGQSRINAPKFGSTAASPPVIQKPVATHGDGEAMVYDAIHQAILNPKYVIHTEFASGFIDPRRTHQYD
ncbi:MAG: hypothetical protein K2X66_15310, partial [Cyanobacteria bacterium]|nr:hypothetical protein [Cyanobacteriota bacterium]